MSSSGEGKLIRVRVEIVRLQTEILRGGEVNPCGFGLLLRGYLLTTGSRSPLFRRGCLPFGLEVAGLRVSPHLLRLPAALLGSMLRPPAHHHDADENQDNHQSEDDDQNSHTGNIPDATRLKRQVRIRDTTLVPHFTFTKDYMLLLVAVLGTTSHRRV